MKRTRADTNRGTTVADGINSALDRILEDDPAAIVMGEDVGKLGGVFRITRGLQEKHGADRVVDTPLAEAGIVGTAIGLALNGFRPIVEIQFDGFVYPALNQICCHMAKYSARIEYSEQLPVVIRLPVGGRIGATEFHSESPEAYFVHTPDLRVVAASTPDTAEALLVAVYERGEACIFLEPKRLYRRHRIPVESTVSTVDPSKARVLRDGGDAVVITYGPCVPDAIEAAGVLAGEGADVAVLDLVSLWPLDTESILEWITRSGRLVVVSEAVRECSIASEVVAIAASQAFARLRSAPLIVAAPHLPPPPSVREADYFPSTSSIVTALREVLR